MLVFSNLRQEILENLKKNSGGVIGFASILDQLCSSSYPLRMMNLFTPRSRSGFTLVELLVVIAIISLLISLLFPALSSANRKAKAVQSQSNLRQWGVAAQTYSNENKESLPWLGIGNWDELDYNFGQVPVVGSPWTQRECERKFWANALPPYLDQRQYGDFLTDSLQDPSSLPLPPADSIYIDPAADIPDNIDDYAVTGWPQGQPRAFFCYVPNAQIDNTFRATYEAVESPGYEIARDPNFVMKRTQVQKPGVTVLMLEKRTRADELRSDDVFFNQDLRQHQSDWRGFAARHDGGGHILRCDGSVQYELNDGITTDSTGIKGGAADYNRPEIIWDPLGPAAQ